MITHFKQPSDEAVVRPAPERGGFDDRRINDLNLPPEALAQLNGQRYKLANIELSADLGEETRQGAKKIVNESFVAGFRVVAYSAAAALAFLSALSAWFLIEGKDIKKTKSEDKQ